MYRQKDYNQLTLLDDFSLQFDVSLSENNRWIKLSKIIPWSKIEEKYAKLFSDTGAPAKTLRTALGSLIIKEKCNFSDRETLQQIIENPYLQYFLGSKSFSDKAPFDASMMVHFRKRLSKYMSEINELICLGKEPIEDDSNQEKRDNSKVEEISNKGKLILDATCAPADISYPTDLALLHKSRVKTEKIIDTLYENTDKKDKKPRTYRKKARKLYLSESKKRKHTKKNIKRAKKAQIQFIERNLKTIEKLIERVGVNVLQDSTQKELSTVKTIYVQQKAMLQNNTFSVENRIVSITQPHIRPIVRGKAGKEVEFGAKVATSVVDGFCYIEKFSWDNFSEGQTLKDSVENFFRRYGCYPEAVLADRIYRNRENINYCAEKNIRLSGPRLGRPKKSEQKTNMAIERKDSAERNQIEGKYGEGKRRYGLSLIMERLKDTSLCAITLSFLVMNLERKLRVLFVRFLEQLFFVKRNVFYEKRAVFLY